MNTSQILVMVVVPVTLLLRPEDKLVMCHVCDYYLGRREGRPILRIQTFRVVCVGSLLNK